MKARRYVADVRENADGTFDLIGVEILSTGGPIHGVGSPPEGDFWTLDALRGMAAADAELGEELLPPNKIGHADEQIMVENSIAAGELPSPANGELPAVGWLEDLRVDGSKLLADVRQVPKVVKDLIELGAYRSRSVELSKVTSQVSGKTYEWVVTGLAWLGGKMPAVKTLGDVVALYQGDIPIRRVLVYNRDYAAAEIVWQPEAGFQNVVSDLQAALNPSGGESRYWVQDVSTDLGRCIVNDWSANATWVVPFTLNTNGDPVPSPATDWVEAEQAWVAAAKEYVDAAAETRFLTLREGRADTGATMKYTAEQIRKFADATGIKVASVTEKMLEDAGVAVAEAPAPTPEAEPAPAPAPEPAPEPSAEKDEEATARENALQARVKALETENHQERRRNFVDSVIRSGKIAPGQRETLETLYDRDADAARKFVEELKPRDDLLEELGSGVVDEETRELEEVERDYVDNAASRLGIAKENLI